MDCLPCEVIAQVLSNIHPIYSDLLTLRQVCWKWKRIIDTTCNLWKHIHLDDDRDCVIEKDWKYIAVLGFCLRTYGRFIQCIRAEEQPFLNDLGVREFVPQLENLRKLEVPWFTWTKELAERFKSKSLNYVMIDDMHLPVTGPGRRVAASMGFKEWELRSIHSWFPNLEHLGLHTSIYRIRCGTIVSMLDPMVKLKDMSLELAPQILNEELSFAFGAKPVRELLNSRHSAILTSLELRYLALSSKDLMEFTKGFTRLKHLVVGSLARMNNDVFNKTLVLESSSLEVLFLSSLPSSWTQTIKIIMPELEVLVISQCLDLISLELLTSNLMTLCLRNNVSLGNIFAKCECLTDIELTECFEFDLGRFRKLVKECPNLMRVELTTEWKSIELTSQDCPNLRSLVIKDSELFLNQVKIDCPTLEVFKCISSHAPRKRVQRHTYKRYQFEINCEDLQLFHICEGYNITELRIKCDTIGTFDVGGQSLGLKGHVELYIRATRRIEVVSLKDLSIKTFSIFCPSITDIILDTCDLPRKDSGKMEIKCGDLKALRIIKCNLIKRFALRMRNVQQLSLDSCRKLRYLDISKFCKARVRIVNCPLLKSNNAPCKQ